MYPTPSLAAVPDVAAFTGLTTAKGMSTRQCWLCAVGSGGLLTLCFEPFNFSWLAFVALAPLLAAVLFSDAAARSGWFRFRLGYAFGFVFVGTAHLWLSQASTELGISALYWLPLVFAAYLGLFPAAFAWLIGWITRGRLPGLLPVMVAAAAWAFHEWAGDRLFFHLRWYRLGVALHGSDALLPLLQISDVTGMAGPSFVLALGNAALGLAIARPADSRRALGFAVAVVLGVYGIGLVKMRGWEKALSAPGGAQTVRVAAIQPNLPHCQEFTKARVQEYFDRGSECSVSAIEAGPDLLVWPEASVLGGMFGRADSRKYVERWARQVPAMMVGTNDVNRFGSGGNFNSVVFVKDGESPVWESAPQAIYDKQVFMPLGEFQPAPAITGRYFPANRFPRLQPGEGPRVFSLDRPAVRVAPLICVEDFVPWVARTAAAAGGDMLVSVGNDNWFGHTVQPLQHLREAAARAIENRRPLVRCTNTGASGTVDLLGHIHPAALGLFTAGSWTQEVQALRNAPLTFYTRHGEMFTALCALLVAVAAALRSWRGTASAPTQIQPSTQPIPPTT